MGVHRKGLGSFWGSLYCYSWADARFAPQTIVCMGNAKPVVANVKRAGVGQNATNPQEARLMDFTW